MIAAFMATALRFRRSTGVERQQLKWFALSTGALMVVLPAAVVLWHVTPVWPVLVAVALTAWPVTIGIAVLRYRLYDVDLVISRAFTYVTLTVVVAVVYAGAAVVLGAVAGGDSPWVTAAATLLAAAAFKLLHERIQEHIDRSFRPGRHKALDLMGTFVEELRNDRAEPESVVDVLREAVGEPGLDLRFLLQPDEPPVDAHCRSTTALIDGDRERYPIRRSGTVLAEVVWSPRSDEDRALLPSVLAAAALPIEMARGSSYVGDWRRSTPRERGSLRWRTRSVVVSSATCTTAPSSAWSRSVWPSAMRSTR